MHFHPLALFQRSERHEGVRRIHIYALRLVYGMMFFLLGQTTWTHILTHRGPWEPDNAMAWSVWAACATLAGVGILRPLKMVPILLLEVFYKGLWLLLVAYPLWAKGTLAGSPVEYQTWTFVGVVIVLAAIPWGYVVANYVYKPKAKQQPAALATAAE